MEPETMLQHFLAFFLTVSAITSVAAGLTLLLVHFELTPLAIIVDLLFLIALLAYAYARSQVKQDQRHDPI